MGDRGAPDHLRSLDRSRSAGGAITRTSAQPAPTNVGNVAASPSGGFADGTGAGTERALEYEWLVEPGEAGDSRVALVNSGFGEGAEIRS